MTGGIIAGVAALAVATSYLSTWAGTTKDTSGVTPAQVASMDEKRHARMAKLKAMADEIAAKKADEESLAKTGLGFLDAKEKKESDLNRALLARIQLERAMLQVLDKQSDTYKRMEQTLKLINAQIEIGAGKGPVEILQAEQDKLKLQVEASKKEGGDKSKMETGWKKLAEIGSPVGMEGMESLTPEGRLRIESRAAVQKTIDKARAELQAIQDKVGKPSAERISANKKATQALLDQLEAKRQEQNVAEINAAKPDKDKTSKRHGSAIVLTDQERHGASFGAGVSLLDVNKQQLKVLHGIHRAVSRKGGGGLAPYLGGGGR